MRDVSGRVVGEAGGAGEATGIDHCGQWTAVAVRRVLRDRRAVAGHLLGEVARGVVGVVLEDVVLCGPVRVVEVLQHRAVQPAVAVALVLRAPAHRVGRTGQPPREVVAVGLQHQVVAGAGGRCVRRIAVPVPQPHLGDAVARGVGVVVVVAVRVGHRGEVAELVVAGAGFVAVGVGDPDRPVVLVVIGRGDPGGVAAATDVGDLDAGRVAVHVVRGGGLTLVFGVGHRVGRRRLGHRRRARPAVIGVGRDDPAREAVGDLLLRGRAADGVIRVLRDQTGRRGDLGQVTVGVVGVPRHLAARVRRGRR